MAHPLLPLAMAAAVSVSMSAPHVNLNAKSHSAISYLKQAGTLILAESHAGEDVHDDNVHNDAHDENHDSGIPGNAQRGKCKAPKDAYGGQQNNTHTPY